MRMSELTKYCGERETPPESVPSGQLNLPCCEGQTFLGAAAERGDIARMKELIARGANLDGIDLHGQPPLVVATLKGKTESVRELLEHGANPDAPDTNGRTALMYALYLGHLDIAKELKSRGVRESIRDIDGRTAADYAGHMAAGKDMKATVEFVEGIGVDPKTVKAKLSPMRSDPDFIALEYIKRLTVFALLRLAFLTWLGLAALQLVGNFGIFWVVASFLYSLPPWFSYPVLYLTPELTGSLGPVESPLVFLLGWLVPFILLLWPILRRRRTARNTEVAQGDTISIDDTFASIGTSDSSARGVANILKQGGRKAFEGLKRETPEKSAERRLTAIALVAVLLLPSVLGLFQGLVLYNVMSAYEWYFPWYQWAALNIALLFFIYLGWRALADFAFFRALIAKQIHRNIRMSERLDDLSEIEEVSGDFILYLRAFRQDGAVRVGSFDFEAVLAYSLAQVTEVVALGEQSGRLGPVELTTDDATWEDRVFELAKRAKLIIMMPAGTKGVEREVQILKESGLLSKCLFVAPPADEGRASDEQAKRWSAMRGFGIFATLDIPGYLSSGFLFRLNEDGELASWDALGLQLEPPPIFAEPSSTTGLTTNSSTALNAARMAGASHTGSLMHASTVHHSHIQHTSHQSSAHSMNISNSGRRM